MDIREFFMLLAIMLCTLLCYCKSEEQLMQLSRDEELEIENRLERLNKSSVKSIKTQNGDTYDCIDFYKQPAFDHHLLKNHIYDSQIKPSSRPKVMTNEKSRNDVEQISINNMFNNETCPSGTVPIRRYTKEDLIRAKLFTKSYSARIRSINLENASFHHAIVRTKFDPSKKYNGGWTNASFYTLDVIGLQYTSGRMKLQNGVDSIQAGWTINPTLYGDSKTHVFAFFQAGELSCFNTMCSGFVLTSPRAIADYILDERHPGTVPVREFQITIYRDQITGNWWLEFGDIQIGYWPSSIFTDLKDLATYVDWGGETYSPIGQPGPPMGSDLFLKHDARYDTYCRQLSIINEAHNLEDAKSTESFSTDVNFYQVENWGYKPFFGYVMTYGGPGPR
ncbi:protein neprosin-like [Cannabis sativa]|uniref:protein neprosin-like n=1 Tax=Cannabis sativa TaxID=3483 RepID=UPI0029CA724F|nr:protein neprosin-like [Cannabis sativa]XP_060974394.1 protein neprosin-like [Cannabis sativa]